MTPEDQTAVSAETTPIADPVIPAVADAPSPDAIPAAAAVEPNEDKVRADRAERAAMRLRREKAEARAEANFYREQVSKTVQQPPANEGVTLTRAEMEAELQRREWQRTETEKHQRVASKISKAAEDDKEFAEALASSSMDFRNDQLAAIRDVIDSSDSGIDVLRYLAKNPDEADRLAGMNPLQIAREFGRLEIKVAELAKPKTSNAPKPLDPVRPASAVNKDPARMTDKEFADWRREQIRQRRA